MLKIGQSENFLGIFLKTGFPLMKNALKPSAKSILIPLGLTAAASAKDAAIHKRTFASGMTTLLISNEEMDDTIKIVKSLKESDLLIKGITQTIENEAKEQKRGFLGMSLGTLSALLLGNLLKSKGTIRRGKIKIRAGGGTITAGQNF